jgi:hypothetical protein
MNIDTGGYGIPCAIYCIFSILYCCSAETSSASDQVDGRFASHAPAHTYGKSIFDWRTICSHVLITITGFNHDRPQSAVDKISKRDGAYSKKSTDSSQHAGQLPNFRPFSAPNKKQLFDSVSGGVNPYDMLGFTTTNKPTATLDEIYRSGKKAIKGSINSSGQYGNLGQGKVSQIKPSMVDRALGGNGPTVTTKATKVQETRDSRERQTHDFSVVPPTKKEISQMAHLVKMFDDTIINKLDCIIVPKQR